MLLDDNSFNYFHIWRLSTRIQFCYLKAMLFIVLTFISANFFTVFFQYMYIAIFLTKEAYNLQKLQTIF